MDTRHRVITFYSYKGGTGRSMALANVACLLAQRSSPNDRVLVIDWDLEAPGLHRYLRPYLQRRFPRPREGDEEFDRHPGLIDLFLELDNATRSGDWKGKDGSEEATKALVGRVDLKKFVIETDIDRLDFLKAGDFGKKYSTNISKFDWEALYDRSPSLFRFFVDRLTQKYSYVLIDSRTGVTDISGICTMLMPDNLVAVFTPNRQSIEGVVEQIRRATDYRKQSDDLRPLIIFPLVSRVDGTRTADRLLWRYGTPVPQGTPDPDIPAYQPLFEQLCKEIYDLPQCDLRDYFDEILIPHYPEYAYGEKIAVKEEGGTDRYSATRTFEDFTDRLVGLAAPWEDLSQASQLSRAPEALQPVLLSLRIFWSTWPGILAMVGLLVGVGGLLVGLWASGVIGIATGGSAPSAPVAFVSVAPEATTIIEGQRHLLHVILKDREGNILTDPTVTWSSSNPEVATVASARGNELLTNEVLVTGITSGVVTITATAEGQSGSATVSVIPVPVAFVLVTPDLETVVEGGRVPLRATLKDVEGNVLTNREVTWVSINPEVATVNGTTGVVTGQAPGIATISATAGGRRGEATIRVTRVPIASVSVSPAAAAITEGKSIPLVAQLRDESGNELTNRVLVWVSSNPGVAKVVSETGLVTGVAPGATTITATSEGRTGAATITVTSVPVATVDVTPDKAGVTQGSRVLLMATLKDAEGNALVNRQVTWSSSNTGAAVVDGSGLVVGIASGISAITAASEGKSGTAVITVIPAVASVLVSPDIISIVQGNGTVLAATPKDDKGNTLRGRIVLWSSSNEGVAGVDRATGEVKAIGPGCVTIKANVEEAAGTESFAVIPAHGSSRQLMVTFDSIINAKSVNVSAFRLRDFTPISAEVGLNQNEIIITLNGTYSFPELPFLQIVGAITDIEGRPAKVICIQPVVVPGAQQK